MNQPRLHHLVPTLLCTALAAQGPDLLLTFSQPERTLSNSGGTSLRWLHPNEIVHLDSSLPCPISAEKWAPRTCFHVQAGDEDSDAMYWNPTLMGAIDALVGGISATPVGLSLNPRSVFYSVSTAVGTGVSGGPGLRPGDLGRFAKIGGLDGKVEYFLRQEDLNIALGLPISTNIDVDAAAFSPGYGVFLSLDQDVMVTTPCGPVLLRDGDVFCLPPWSLTYTSDFRIAATTPNSAVVVHTEAQIDAFVQNAQITDRFGTCLTQAIDLESLEIDWGNPITTMVPCPGLVLTVPAFLFSTETMTGASILTTANGGQIHNGPCGPYGRTCGGGGPTLGIQTGIQPTTGTIGAPSYVNGLLSTWTLRYPMEARTPVLNSAPNGLAAGATLFDVASPAPWNWSFVSLVPAGVNAVPASLPLWPFSQLGYPDYFPVPTPYLNGPTVAGHWTFPSFPIPPNFPVKLLFQCVGFVNGNLEASTPALLDIQ
jgi:hypothetical protein